MHNGMNPDRNDASEPYDAADQPGAVDPNLQPLLRLRQLAEELKAAAHRNDLEVVCQTAGMLAPTVERCEDFRDRMTDSAGEAAQIAIQIRSTLAECETILTQALRGIAKEMRRIQQGKRALALARQKSMPVAAAGNLDAMR